MTRKGPLQSYLIPQWLIPILFLIRQFCYGCSLFSICKRIEITCNVMDITGNWTRVTSGEYCRRNIVLRQAEIFNSYHNLSEYKLSNSSLDRLQTHKLAVRLGIRLIESGAFHDLFSILEVLDISENQLANLQKGLFYGLTKVRRLNLSLNRFSTVPIEALRGLRSLRDLMLARNNLRYIKKDDFIGLPNLMSLDLSYNEIRQIDSHAFLPLSHLQMLSIHSNSFYCDCALIWLRHYDSCLCVLNYDNCASPPIMRQYSVLNYSAEALDCKWEEGRITSMYERCGNVSCQYVTKSSSAWDDHTNFLDTALETPLGEELDESGDILSTAEEEFFSILKAKNISRETHEQNSGKIDNMAGEVSDVDAFCCHIEISATTISGEVVMNGSSKQLTTAAPRSGPRAERRASEGWMAALLIGGLFLLIVLIIGGIHLAQKVRRYCPLGHSRQPLPTVDTGQVMYASSTLMDDTDERTATSDVTDM